MAVKSFQSHEYSCDWKGCDSTQATASVTPPEWGIVRVYDNKYHRDIIGDQNGWNNFDMCPIHYEVVMNGLGIESHNIPSIPEGEPG